MGHPLDKGQKVLSRNGETSDTDDADGVFTGENAVGEIVTVDYTESQGFTYGVAFEPSGVMVFLTAEEIDRPGYTMV